jgi:hypothetical protein
VLTALEGVTRPAGSEYDLPLRAKRAVCEAILDRELELVRFPRFEYIFLLEEAFRERSRRDPTLTLRFEHHVHAIPRASGRAARSALPGARGREEKNE